jgi:hypothetical protein
MEQQLKQQLMQKKKTYANLSQKEESTVFSILPFAKIVPTMKKTPSTIISKSRIHISK